MLLNCALTTSLFLLPLVAGQGALYTKNSPVLQLDSKSYDRLIGKSNYTSIVEFYAPWCGHCQNLKPAYEKAATALEGYAKVAAVNCDAEENKPFCGQMGIKGFPTLKIVKPAKKPGNRPVAEDYNGPRTAKAINDALLEKMPNHVKKLTDKNVDEWLKQEDTTAKGILFTEKSQISPLMKALAIDFLQGISFAQVKSSEKDIVSKYGIESFPTMLLLPSGDAEAIKYSGDLKKAPLVSFFSQASAPNPEFASASSSKPKASKKAASKDKQEKDKPKSKTATFAPKGHPPADDASGGECPFSKSSASQKSSEASASAAPGSSATIDDSSSPPTSSPDPKVAGETPVKVPTEIPPIPALDTDEALQTACLTTQSGTCILALLPPTTESSEPEGAAQLPAPAKTLVDGLAEIAHKHRQRGAAVFPFYTVPAVNAAGMTLGVSLGLYDNGVDSGVRLVAVNAKKKWFRGYAGEAVERAAVEGWVDDIRFGDFKKEKLPGDVQIVEGVAKPKKPKVEEPPVKVEVVEEADDHDEL